MIDNYSLACETRLFINIELKGKGHRQQKNACVSYTKICLYRIKMKNNMRIKNWGRQNGNISSIYIDL